MTKLETILTSIIGIGGMQFVDSITPEIITGFISLFLQLNIGVLTCLKLYLEIKKTLKENENKRKGNKPN